MEKNHYVCFNGILTPIHIVVRSARKFYYDDCFTLSSSISFVFLLSIIPFASLNILIFTLVEHFLFPENATISNIKDAFAREMVHLIPFVSKDWVKTYIFQSDSRFSSFRIMNLILLPLISGLVFKTLESSYRKIFMFPKRPLLFSRALYALLAIFIALLFFITGFTWNIISPIFRELSAMLNDTNYFSLFNHKRTISFLYTDIHALTLFVVFAFYIATVKIFLNGTIKIIHTIITGFIFCSLWMVARLLFQSYLDQISKLNVLYGSLSSIIAVLLWIFYSSLTLLYSIELLYTIHSSYTKKEYPNC